MGRVHVRIRTVHVTVRVIVAILITLQLNRISLSLPRHVVVVTNSMT